MTDGDHCGLERMPSGGVNPASADRAAGRDPRRGIGATGLLGFCLALLALNTLLTVHNVWPTVWVRPVAELSLELTVIVLAAGLLIEWRGRLGRRAIATIAVLVLVLAAGRYADVTAPALFGRAINAYWDVPHLPKVFAMLASVSSTGQMIGYVAGAFAVVAAVTALTVWSVRTMGRGLAVAATRRGAMAITGGLLVIYGAGMASRQLETEHWFSLPVTPVYARQAAFVAENTVPGLVPHAYRGGVAAESDLARLQGADLFLVFFESYGATLFDRPVYRKAMAERYARLQAELDEAGWHAVSAFADSPTFGGSSWLAHASVLSGHRIADQRSYQAWLASGRATLIDRFRTAGYRTVGLLPGIKSAWPEGNALALDTIHDAAALGYRGPEFGWWAIPDQFSLARLRRLEFGPAPRRPLFVFFPMITSHMPFQPIPPYEPDWSRLDGGAPFAGWTGLGDESVLDGRGLERAYVRAIDYGLAVLGGFLSAGAPENAVIVVLGDHQPAAIVSGPDASSAVPVHVFARRSDLLEPFRRAGFRARLVPDPAAIAPMESIGTLILEGYNSGE